MPSELKKMFGDEMRRMLRATVGLAVAAVGTVSGTGAQQASKPVKLEVDLREAARRIYHAKMEFAVKPGPFTLVYPKWIPGEHAPNGPIVDVTGVKFFAGGKEVTWRRDTADMYAFACEGAAGGDTLGGGLGYFLPQENGGGGGAGFSG